MPRTCTVCRHPHRDAIDQALVASEPFRNVSLRFGTSVSALFRHKADHLPQALVKAAEAGEVARADSLLEEVRSLQTKALDILRKAEAAGDLRAAVSAVREARGNIELLAKLIGELDERDNVNVAVMLPEQARQGAAEIVDRMRGMADREFASHKHVATTQGRACTSCLCLDSERRASSSLASQIAQIGRE